MQLLLDSADEAQIRYWWGQGILDGVTTNPSVMRRDKVSNPIDTITKIAGMVSPGAVHAEVTSPNGSALVAEATALSRLGGNVVVKVPVLTPQGEPLLREISELTAAGVPVNCTACLSLPQVMMAAKAGAPYISVLVGRIDDEGGQGADVLGAACAWLANWRLPARLIAASIRGPGDVGRSMRAGAHSITVAPEVLAKTVDHKYSRHTVKQFLDDAVATGRAERYLCFLDSDVMLERTLLAQACDFLDATGAKALLPHSSLLYLDRQSSETAIRRRLQEPGRAVVEEECNGYRLMTNRGGCIFVESELFHTLGGFDERYEGWGDEDNEFFDLLAANTRVIQLAHDLSHLYHPRSPMTEKDGRRANDWALHNPDGRPVNIGDPSRVPESAGRPPAS